MDLSGKWLAVWTIHGQPLTRADEIESVELALENGQYTGSFTWRGNTYRLTSRLVSGIFLTGRYEDLRGGRSFVGAFQLATFPGNQTMGGRWIGFDYRNRVLYGPWQWRRPPVAHYPFERWGNSYFISYAHEQANIADHFEALLRRRHCVVLRDESRMMPGMSLSRAVANEIAAANTVLLLHSKDFRESDWCRAEAVHALRLKAEKGIPRRVIIVDLDGCSIDPPFSDLMIVNGVDRMARERAVLDLYEDVE
jgi:hypothetical protein